MIHAHWIIPQGFVAAICKKLYGVPYVVTSHGSDIMGLKGFDSIKKFTLRNADKITVVSNAIKEEVLTNIDSSLEDKIEVIPMGVDTKLFNPNKKDNSIKKKHKINGPFLLFVGRLAPEKGVSYLIEAIPSILKKYPKAKLMLIGDGTLKEELVKKVEELKIENSVVFMGKIQNKNLPKYYATADIFVSPSLREGSPVSYIESLSCGTPIIVGDLPVSREIVGANRGFVVNPKDIKNISNNIIRLLSKNKIIKSELYNSIQRDYDWENIANQFKGVLKWIFYFQ